MKEHEIIDKMVTYLSGIPSTTVIAYDDYEFERTNNMIVVAINNTEQLYPTTCDYKYDMTVLIDTFIADDLKGELRDVTEQAVHDKLNSISLFGSSDVFGDLPIVGYIVNKKQYTQTEESYQTTFSLSLFGSF